jgi:VWFA-related protein
VVRIGLSVLALALVLSAGAALSAPAQEQPAPVPDAPAPQPKPSLTTADGVSGPIVPGSGSGETPLSGSSTSTGNQSPTPPPAQQAPDDTQKTPPQLPAAGEGMKELTPLVRTYTNLVVVPVTVKDNKGKLVPGLTWRDFKIFENGQLQHINFFTADAAPLSMAFVIDQSVTSDVMSRVNDSLAAVQNALTPYDEIAIFSYGHLTHEWTGFTGAQSARVPYVFSEAKTAGAEEETPVNSGPLAGCPVSKNGQCVDPNIQPGGATGGGPFMTIPKEIHTLNDAILAAAKELSSRPKERRRVIYVISDGKEYGSKATYKEVLRYLETNNITVYGTLVGDSARWGEGYLSKFHLPFTMYDNRLTAYVITTGGTLYSERGVNGIEDSYAKLAEEARTQYTLTYNTHEPFIDGKFRKIEVRVERPGLDITAKDGYYPSARDAQ